MTLEQWAQVEAAIAAGWPHARQMDETQVRLRHQIVTDPEMGPPLPLRAALVVVAQMNRAGREWPPTPGQLYAAAMASERQPAPAAGTVIALLRRAAGTFGRHREADALRWLAEQPGGLHAARFAVEHGWRQWCLEGIDDPQHGGAVRHRIEQSATASVAGLEREYRDGRVLPLVGRRLQHLDAAQPDRGLRRLTSAAVTPERQALPQNTDPEGRAA